MSAPEETYINTDNQTQGPADALDLAQFDGHTPGEWVLGQEDETDGDVDDYGKTIGWYTGRKTWDRTVIVENADGTTVTICELYQGQLLANARLIAASPRLLSELTALRAQVAELQKERDDIKDKYEWLLNDIGVVKVQNAALRGQVEGLSELLVAAESWITLALTDDEWQCDTEQEAAATVTRDALRTALAALPAGDKINLDALARGLDDQARQEAVERILTKAPATFKELLESKQTGDMAQDGEWEVDKPKIKS